MSHTKTENIIITVKVVRIWVTEPDSIVSHHNKVLAIIENCYKS